jgi:hypothetical protein
MAGGAHQLTAVGGPPKPCLAAAMSPHRRAARTRVDRHQSFALQCDPRLGDASRTGSGYACIESRETRDLTCTSLEPAAVLYGYTCASARKKETLNLSIEVGGAGTDLCAAAVLLLGRRCRRVFLRRRRPAEVPGRVHTCKHSTSAVTPWPQLSFFPRET